jgi:hypothetical protein
VKIERTKYSLDLPVSKKYYSNIGRIEVECDTYNVHGEDYFKETYQMANYLDREFYYKGTPFDISGHMIDNSYKAFLFTDTDYDHISTKEDNVKYDKAPYSQCVYGACHFSKLNITNGDYWNLNWIWIHPFFRHRGMIKDHWKYFEEKFGNFYVAKPASPEMKNFLNKSTKKHELL